MFERPHEKAFFVRFDSLSSQEMGTIEVVQ